jgi:hypothetical protein
MYNQGSSWYGARDAKVVFLACDRCLLAPRRFWLRERGEFGGRRLGGLDELE